jgi:beta-glucosidase
MSCSTSLIVALTLATALPGSSATGVADAAGSTPLSFPFQNVTLGLEQRIDDLLSRMTVKEKIGQMFMNSKMAFGNDVVPKGGDLPSTAIPRLGVGEFIFMGDGNVYRGAGNGCNIGCCSCYNPPTCTGGACCCVDQAATQFPQGTGVAATWNLPLVFKMGVVASDESWALQNRPNASQAPTDYRSGASSVINILRDGRWGRAPETYGGESIYQLRMHLSV